MRETSKNKKCKLFVDMETMKNYGLILVVYFLSCASMFTMHFTPDTYYAIQNASTYGKRNVDLGRYTNELIYGVFRLMGIDYEKWFYFIIFFMIISFSIFSLFLFKKLIKGIDVDNMKHVCVFVSALIPLINVFVQEWYAFWECGFQWSFSILLMGGALYFISIDMSYKQYILSFVFLVLSLGCYQASLSIYIILGIAVLYMESTGKLSRNVFIKNVMIFVISGLASLVNLLSIKFFQILGIAAITDRTDSISLKKVFDNIIVLARYIPKFIVDNCGLYPKGVALSISLVLLILSVLYIMKKEGEKGNRIAYVILSIFGGFCSVFIPHFFTSNIWLAQRTMVGFWSLFTLIITIFIVNVDKKTYLYIGSFLVFLMYFIGVVMMNSIEIDLVATNSKDADNAMVIQDRINEYQEETGIYISSIGTVYDMNTVWKYPDTKYDYCDTNTSAHAKPWSDVDYINYYNKTNYSKIDVNIESVLDKARNNNWDYFDVDEQLIFDGDTLYIIIY